MQEARARVVLGLIYSRVYYSVPKKGILRWLVYGFFLYFIISFRMETYNAPYARFLNVAGDNLAGFFSYLCFGLVLGILYEFFYVRCHPTVEELRTKEYDMRSGLLPGAITRALVPSKGVMKGLIYGPTVFLITSFQIGIWCICWAIFHGAWPLVMRVGGALIVIGAPQAIVFGLVLGALYRKPSD